MTLSEMKTELEAMSDEQIARMNQSLTSKVYNESEYVLQQHEKDQADNLTGLINGLGSGDLDTLTASLSSSRKLSTRPC